MRTSLVSLSRARRVGELSERKADALPCTLPPADLSYLDQSNIIEGRRTRESSSRLRVVRGRVCSVVSRFTDPASLN